MGVYSLTKSSIKNWVKYPNMMAGSAYIDLNSDYQITETILGSSAASVTFDVSTLAAAGYKHLQIRYAATFTTYGNLNMTFNSDTTSSNYYAHFSYSTGGGVGVTATASQQHSYQWNGGINGTIIDIADAFSATKNKTSKVISVNTIAGAGANILGSHLWKNTAAITSVTISKSNENFPTGSRISLYASKG